MSWISYCSSGGCIEVTRRNGYVLVRNSEYPGAPSLTYTSAEWTQVLTAARQNGLPAGVSKLNGLPAGVSKLDSLDDDLEWVWEHQGVKLTFTTGEMEDFLDGVDDGVFDL